MVATAINVMTFFLVEEVFVLCVCVCFIFGFTRFCFFFSHQVLTVACEIFSCVLQTSVAACGIYFPDLGANLGPLHWEQGLGS